MDPNGGKKSGDILWDMDNTFDMELIIRNSKLDPDAGLVIQLFG